MPDREPARGGGPPRRAERRSLPVLCLWTVVLVLLLPALVLYGQEVRPGAALALQCVVVAHTGTALARVLTDPRVRVVAFGFWLFCYVWLGLAALAMVATETYPWGFAVDPGTAFGAAAVVEAGLLAYSAGAALAGRRPDATPGAPGVLEPLLARRVTPLRVLLLCGLALLLAAVLVPAQGGLAVFFQSRQAVNEAAAQSVPGAAADQALAAWSLSVPAFWALVALLYVPRARGGDRTLRGLRWILLPVLLALNAVVNNPVSQPRFWAGTVLLTILFGTSLLRRPRAFRIGAVAVTVAVLTVFPYGDYFRHDKRRPVEVVSLAEQFTSNGDYDAFQQIATGLDHVRENGHSPGDAPGPPLFFVPRAVWPDKPEDSGVLLARHAGYSFENLSAPLWIETYMWAGFPGVVAFFALLGAVSRRIDGIRDRLREHGGTLAALAVPAFGFYQLILLRGSLMFVMGPLSLLIAVPLLVTAGARRRRPAPPPGGEFAGGRAGASAGSAPPAAHEPPAPPRVPVSAAWHTAPSPPSTGEART
ncbi:hypothetical protein V1L54_13220 [Streptomyces sp. TRM 70361]|uniref:hypothetical protein n=1 Tax=Streptomyces sp. TRM 70361 TaxID=3116553 RepID=UPI002E7BCA60|nr:hypothetical protein [Streptomyces sp. TRM 70361]MEE1940352.1 hypothetical protein [Streptomyces sp. TRM 70361]